ncbi:hypothetical protein Bbelb_319580 [Branchiostoma belcheri]|nr:hypothetical protein Bbelb_319580 [Branchiostoma belcheri]
MYEQAQPVRSPVVGPGNSQTSGPQAQAPSVHQSGLHGRARHGNAAYHKRQKGLETSSDTYEDAETVNLSPPFREARLQRAGLRGEPPMEGADANLPDAADTSTDNTYPSGQANGRRGLRDFVRPYRGCILGATAVVATLVILGLVVMVFHGKKRSLYDLKLARARRERQDRIGSAMRATRAPSPRRWYGNGYTIAVRAPRSVERSRSQRERSESVQETSQLSDTVDVLKGNMDSISQLSDTVDTLKRNMDSISQLSDTVDTLKRSVGSISQLSDTVDTFKRNMDSISQLSDTVDTLKRNMDSISQLSDTVDTLKRNMSSERNRIDAMMTFIRETGIRLVGGSSRNEGRVEVFHDGQWGTVCDDLWELNDAHVVCRQLGYPSATEARVKAAFGPGSGKIWLDNVACRGSEKIISDCGHNGWGSGNCKHSEDAGVVCKCVMCCN